LPSIGTGFAGPDDGHGLLYREVSANKEPERGIRDRAQEAWIVVILRDDPPPSGPADGREHRGGFGLGQRCGSLQQGSRRPQLSETSEKILPSHLRCQATNSGAIRCEQESESVEMFLGVMHHTYGSREAEVILGSWSSVFWAALAGTAPTAG
jgi:hypothetical protein